MFQSHEFSTVIRLLTIPVVRKVFKKCACKDQVNLIPLKPGILRIVVEKCDLHEVNCRFLSIREYNVVRNQVIKVNLSELPKPNENEVIKVIAVHEPICLNELCLRQVSEIVKVIG